MDEPDQQTERPPLPVPSHFMERIANASELYWCIDAAGNYTYLNAAWEKLLGFAPEEMLGRPFSAFQPPEEAEVRRARLRGFAAAPGPVQSETVFRRKDGSLVRVFFHSTPLFENGAFAGFSGMGFDMTAIRDHETRLEMDRYQLETFIASAPTAIAIFDADLRYIAYSERWLEDYGLAGRDLKGRHHYEVFPSIAGNEDWKDVHRRALAGETLQRDEDTFIGADGKREWLRWVVRPWYLKEGRIGGIVMLTESITARKRAELELRQSEERYRQLADSAFEAVLIHDQGIVVEVNAAFLRIFGFSSREEIVGRDGMALLFDEESRRRVRERIARGITDPQELTCVRTDGTRFVGLTQAREVEYGGKAMRLVTMRDFTEIRRHRDALAAEKERLRVTLHSIGDGVIATDTAGRVRMMNAVAEGLTGWSQAEAEGMPLRDVFRIVHEFTRQECGNPVDKVLATGERIELANHTLLIARDGAERVIADSGAPIRDAEGRIVGVVLVFRDTTEKQKLVAAAQRSQKLESLGILAGGIAHDFNNLLGAIYGYIDLAHARTSDADVAPLLARALATIDRARGLTQQLLTFAKGGAPVRKAAALFPFVEETVRFILSGSAVGCRFDVEPGLPPAFFDRNQIGQVIDNLALNAQQAMPLGGVFSVSARASTLAENQVEGLPAGDYVRISFADTGIGIPAEILPRIFDPFFTTKQKGSGLGLATCYSILKQHDGGIEAESEPGKGTVFHVYLPVSREAADAVPAPAPAPERGRGWVLLMDDEDAIRDMIGLMLRDEGYRVESFADGAAALEFLSGVPESDPPAAILLDLTVPGGKGGRDVAPAMRRKFPAAPIIVSSGYADDPIMAEPERFGVDAGIGKPFRRNELLSLMARVAAPGFRTAGPDSGDRS